MNRKVVKIFVIFVLLLTSLFLMVNSSGGTRDQAVHAQVLPSTSTQTPSVPPAVEWQKTFRFGENAFRVLQTNDGGYAIIGGGYSKSIKIAATLIKLDSSGNMQWNKNLTSINPASLVLTSDGGYAIAGNKDEDVTLLKTDSNGNVQWNQTYIGGEGASLVQTNDGGYAIASSINIEEIYFPGRRAYELIVSTLIKADSSGKLQWSKTYNLTEENVLTYSIRSLIQTSDGGYALAGSAASRSPGDSDFWLLKINPEGNVQWTKTFGGLDDDNANSVVQSSDGGYVLAGSTNSFGAGGSDAWLVKTDSMGNLMWTRTYGGVGWLNALNGVPVDSAVGSDGSGDDSANCVIQTSDGGLAFTGATPFHVEWSSSFVWLVKTDSSGNIQWNQTYSTYSSEQRGIEASSINTWSGNSLIETSKGAFAIAGYAQQGGFPYLNGAYYLVKTQPALPPPSESPSPNPSSTPSTSPKPSPILEFPPTTISADGDVNPSTAPIQRNGNVYTFTGNLNGPLVVKRDNIVIDGAAYSLQGNGTAGNLFIRMTKTGIDLAGRTNVTVKNLQVYSYKNGIYLNGATNVTISGNNIAQNGNGVFETNSAHATISENNITQNNDGVFVTSTSSNNNITNNNIVSNPDTGITLNQSVGNVIFGNNISNNGNGGGDGLSGIFLDSGLNNLIAGNILYGDRYGISMGGSTGAIIAANNITGCSFGVIATDASGNVFCMNDFNNTHINEFSGEGSNSWDNGTVGNYWSDYTTRYPNAKELDSSGIGDTPYFMVYGYTPSTPNDPNTPNPNNVDLHPLMAPISSASAAALAQALVLAHSWSPTSTQSPSTNLILFASLALVAVVIVLVAVVVLKCRKKQIQATLSAPS